MLDMEIAGRKMSVILIYLVIGFIYWIFNPNTADLDDFGGKIKEDDFKDVYR